jgi:DNA segregation ATPase FtsK/SpoIIIE, S-DNA-T family
MRTTRTGYSPIDFLPDALRDLAARWSREILGLGLLGLAALLSVALATWSVNDPSLTYATSQPVTNLLGAPGAAAADLLMQIFGLASLVLVLMAVVLAARLIAKQPLAGWRLRLASAILGLVFASAFAAAIPQTASWPLRPMGLGGFIGDAVLGVPAFVIGGLGGFSRALAALGFGFLTILCLAFATGKRETQHAGFEEAAPPRPRPVKKPADAAREEDDDLPDDSPGFALIALGATIGAVSATKQKVLALFERKAPHFDDPAPRALALSASEDTPLAAIRREPHFESDPEDEPVMHAAVPQNVERQNSESLNQAMRAGLAARGRSMLGMRLQPVASPGATDEEGIDFALDDRLEDFTEEARSPSMEAEPRAPGAARVAGPPATIKPGRRQTSEAQVPMFPDPAAYRLPPLLLLAEPKKIPGYTISQDALEQNARLLEGVLEDFSVRGEIINVRPGPVVTLYELEPAPGTKSSRVIGLAEDIARSMSAIAARVAVVSGRNAIGIELPNSKRETVFLRELLASADFESSKFRLPICLGKTIGGEPVIVELAKMPHLLIAGTTGSGKSVAVNTMILSLLYRLKPEECKLIMIDPKMLELSVYDGIPHLLTPVVTDPKKAVIALKWAVREMEERYRKMSKVGVRNIDGFNTRAAEALQAGETFTRQIQTGFDRETGEPIYETEEIALEQMPFIVVIIDEMADLMMVAGKDIEGAVQRLAQMARAAGIHVIMATQRPSVDVITGTIKANFPTRISFQVTSKIDSRTILGEQGAEQLLGQGDMLYMAGGGRISRVHGPFVSDGEVEKVVAHLKSQGRPNYLDDILAEDEEVGEEGEDGAVFDKGAFGEEGGDLYDQAIRIVLRDKKCSTSYIQRRLGVGYNKAASLVERMEKEGLVGPANHAGKRDILMSPKGSADEMDDEDA